MNGSTWTAYYESQGDRAPRDLLVSTLDAFGPGARDAIDLGCGTGIETVAILRRGWRVFAVDAEPVGIERLLVRASAPERERLQARVGSIEDVALPTADLVWAGYSLFFIPPQRFATTWTGIRASVQLTGPFGRRPTLSDLNGHSRHSNRRYGRPHHQNGRRSDCPPDEFQGKASPCRMCLSRRSPPR